jgi:flagellar protein FlaG
MSNDIRSSLASTMPTSDRDRRATAAQGENARGNAAPAEAANTGRSEAVSARDTSATTESPTRQRTEDAAREREEAEQAARALEEKTREMGRNLRFEVDDDSGTTVIKVVDPATDEIVRQIPSEEAVARAAALQGSDLNLINESA